MIVCSCNVLTDRAIRATLGDGGACGGRMSDVFGCLGCRPQCGRCAPTIKRLIREATPDDGGACSAALDDLADAAHATSIAYALAAE